MKINLSALLTAFFISTASILSAQSITINTAKEIAKNHLIASSKRNLKSAGPKQIKFQFSVSTAVENKDTLYFVLNDTINNGFVIVSADKRVWPILGYSLDGIYNDKNQPTAFIEWMENRKQEIKDIKRNNLQPDSAISATWNNLISANTLTDPISVEPLLQTKWNQGCYYNSLCPSDVAGSCGAVVTGCVATSMAQIMKYWNFPITGKGSHSYKHSTYGTLSANFGSTTYLWSQMPNSVTSQNNDVATLMFHCGVSVDMDYSPDASSAGVPRNALVNYFNYSSNAQYVNKSSYTTSDWENLLKFELNSHRPIWYRGEGSGGHAFVCDGYQNTNYFHFNWGWGGYQDGYFYLENLNPSGRNYTSYQGAIIKTFPSSTPDEIGAISGSAEVCQGQNSVNYYVTPISNAASYVWTLPTGATGISTTNSINVNFGTNAQSGTIKVKAQNNLGVTSESTLAITVNPKPGTPGLISGNKMVCIGIPEVYNISPVAGASNYTWQLPSGWSGSSTSNSITVIPGTTGGTISVMANNTNCSGAASSLNVTLGEPVSPSSISASQTNIIVGQSTTLSVVGGKLNSAPNWIWYSGNCGETTVGTGTTLSVSPTSTTTYYVQAAGCGLSTICKSVTINVCIDLSAGTIAGNKMVCPDVSEVYSIPDIAGATGYIWQLPSGWKGSSTSSSITVIPGTSNGTITVKAYNTTCTGGTSSLSVKVGVPVSPSYATANQTTILAGQSATLSVVGGTLNSAPNWIWYTESCGGTLIGTGATLVVSPATTTTYYVQATGCGIPTTCKSVTINVCAAPPSPNFSSASIGSPANGTSHKVNFDVESVPGADGYSWDYSWDGINWQVNWFQRDWTNLNWDLSDRPNIPVYLRVRAYKCSPLQYSNYTYTSPQPIYTACDEPASPTVNTATTNSLNVTLNAETPVANPSITTYSIYCTTTDQYLQIDGTLGNTEVFQNKSTWATKTVTGLASEKQYCFYAKARNNDGDVRFNTLNSACGTTLSSPLSAAFSSTITSGCSPMTVNFTDESTGNPTSWAWDVDNNGTIDYTTKTPTHTYSNAGTYPVKLTVSNTSGSDSKTLINYITVNSTVSPDVKISATPTTTINAGQLVTFTATPTNGGTNPKYEWMVNGVVVGLDSPTYTTTGLTNEQIVTCVMTSNSPCASSATAISNSITINVNFSVKSEVISVTDLIKVFPNPTSGVITIEGLPENKQSKIALFSVNGKLIIKKTTSGLTEKLDLSKQVSGTYLLMINKHSVKIVKE